MDNKKVTQFLNGWHDEMGLLEKHNSMLQLLFDYWAPLEAKKRTSSCYKCAHTLLEAIRQKRMLFTDWHASARRSAIFMPALHPPPDGATPFSRAAHSTPISARPAPLPTPRLESQLSCCGRILVVGNALRVCVVVQLFFSTVVLTKKC